MMYADLLGMPFVPGGRGPDGYDCYGLVLEIYHRLGKPLPELVSDIHENEALHSGYLHVINVLTPVESPAPWSVVAFRLQGSFVTHAGVVLPDCRRFIHIRAKASVNIQKLSSPLWQHRIAGFYICP